ncbi:hypothetical protein AYX07_01830 [Thermoactinomyces sp. AS95]|nr:hypothetical protein JS81_01565 [Thermoactinomyces sp. Gus2-1]KYQ87463.1 hypothetical protein AYX07_01830 [Thermoactinomyces sp. AS95]RMB03790.1 hypothetical protein ATH33_0232 [Thermoactinomyces vulgaris]
MTVIAKKRRRMFPSQKRVVPRISRPFGREVFFVYGIIFYFIFSFDTICGAIDDSFYRKEIEQCVSDWKS